MTISEELGQLSDLHQRGRLSDDEFSRAKARVLEPTGEGARDAGIAVLNGLQRSRSDRWLGGVCGGLAESSGIASWGWRVFFTLLVLCAGTGIAAYLLLWFFVPDSRTPMISERSA